jgi:anti-sigma factor RsiW
MTKKCCNYSEQEISRYIDGELPRHQLMQIRQHLDTCPACRDLAGQFRDVTHTFNEMAERPGMVIDPARLYPTRVTPADSSGRLNFGRFFNRPARPLLAAAASIAALFLISVYALKHDRLSPAGPSAIVTSIETEYTAVMILETPDNHHTIIWYSET